MGILLRMNSPFEPITSRLLKELDRSGLSVAAFARERRVPAHRLYWARRQAHREREAIPASDFVAVHVATPAVVDHSPATAVELRLPSGLSIVLDRHFDEGTLRRVLDVVAQC